MKFFGALCPNSYLNLAQFFSIMNMKILDVLKKCWIGIDNYSFESEYFIFGGDGGSLRRTQLSSFVFAAPAGHATNLMGKGGAAARHELVELCGDSIEVDV